MSCRSPTLTPPRPSTSSTNLDQSRPFLNTMHHRSAQLNQPRIARFPLGPMTLPLVSTEEQAEGGASLDALETALNAYADADSWDTMLNLYPAASGKSLQRPDLPTALGVLADGGVDFLLVVRLDRLTRSVQI